MNRKRNVNYIKPEDPEFLKVLKRQAGYDEKNHKFDDLMNAKEDFVDDDDSEQPQVVVLKEGDLTAEQAEIEKKKIEKLGLETKADLNRRIIFKPKEKPNKETETTSKRKITDTSKSNKCNEKKSRQLLSFEDDDDDDEDNDQT